VDTTHSHTPFWITVPLVTLNKWNIWKILQVNFKKNYRFILVSLKQIWICEKSEIPSFSFFCEVFCPPRSNKKNWIRSRSRHLRNLFRMSGRVVHQILELSVGQNLRIPQKPDGLLNRCWGLLRSRGFLGSTEPTQPGGGQILTLHLNYVAGYTEPSSSSSNGPSN